MREEIHLSPEGFYAVCSFIGQLWSMTNLDVSKSPSKLIADDARWQSELEATNILLVARSIPALTRKEF